MADPGVKAKLADQGLTVAGDTPEQFRGFIETESRKWSKVIKDAGVADGVQVRGSRLARRLVVAGASSTFGGMVDAGGRHVASGRGHRMMLPVGHRDD